MVDVLDAKSGDSQLYHPLCAWMEGVNFDVKVDEDFKERKRYIRLPSEQIQLLKSCREDYLPDSTEL